MSRERFLSERVAGLGWKIPGLDTFKKYHLQEWITQKERGKLRVLEKQVLQKLQTLHSERNTREAPGYRGAMIGFTETLVGDDRRKYRCTIVTDIQRLEVEVVDLPLTSDKPIRKYRIFLGKFDINGKTTTCDLSCLYDKPFSWRRNFSDNDRPEKGLTLKESYQFMEEILHAYPESSQPSSSAQLLK